MKSLYNNSMPTGVPPESRLQTAMIAFLISYSEEARPNIAECFKVPVARRTSGGNSEALADDGSALSCSKINRGNYSK